MAKVYSKQHEREEKQALRKSLVRTLIGLFTCWLPGVGLLFSISGFWRAQVRITIRHRVRRGWYLALSIAVLALSTAVLLGEVRHYCRDPQIVQRVAQYVWTDLLGQQGYDKPYAEIETKGTEYDDMDTAGLGVPDDAFAQMPQNTDDVEFWTEEEWAALEDNFDWDAWEDAEFADSWLDEDDDPFAGMTPEELTEWFADAPFFADDDTEQEHANASGASFNAGKGEKILPPTQ